MGAHRRGGAVRHDRRVDGHDRARGRAEGADDVMKVEVVTGALEAVKADALIVGLSTDDKRLPPSIAALDRRASGRIAAVLAAERFQGKPGAVTHVHVADGSSTSRVVVTGLGSRKDSGAEMVRRAAAA